MNRFGGDDLANEQLASKLIEEHPATRWGGPKLWEDIDKDYMSALKAKNEEAGRLAKQKEGQLADPVLLRPEAFQHAKDKKRFEADVKNFMETNNLGSISEDGKHITFSEGVLQADVENALRSVNTGTLPASHQQNWKGYLMKSLKEGDRGSRDAGGRVSFNEVTRPAADYNQAMRDLEKLHSYRRILNDASGGFGFNTPPERFGLLSSFSKDNRPAFGLYDLDLEVKPRLASQSAVNAYERREELADYAEAMVKAGKWGYEQAVKFMEANTEPAPRMPLTMERQCQ
jgi:hypothetical protein